MNFTHEDIRERLVDFLYGELEGEARAAFDAHVAACAECRADVAAFQRTRTAARAAVRAGLEEPPPAGVRARVLAAAAAAAAGKSTAAASAEVAAGRAAVEAARKPSRSAVPAGGERSGPFAWLRARWAVPMFVTVAAMGALLLVRETVFREARQPIGESPASAPPPSATAPAEQASPKGEAREPEPTRPADGTADAEKRRGPTRDRARAAASEVEDRRPAPAKKEVARAIARKAGGVGGVETKAAPKAASARASRDNFESRAERQFAQPPPAAVPAEAPVAAPAAAPVPAAPGRSAAPVDRAGGGAALTKVPRKADLDEFLGERAAAPRPMARAESEAAGVAVEASDPATPLAARAERLMAARRWAEAASAYKELLARFPKHEQAPNWQRRLSVVQAAARAGADAGFATPPPPR